MKKTIFTITLSVFLFHANVEAQLFGKKKKQEEKSKTEKPKGDFKDYKDIIKGDVKSDDGLFTTHELDGKLYYEIPFDKLEKDLLLVSRIVKLPDNFGGGYINAGSKVNEQVVRWHKRDKNIDLKVISFQNESDEDSPIYKSVEANNFFPILYSTKIEAVNPDSTAYLVDVSSLFTDEQNPRSHQNTH